MMDVLPLALLLVMGVVISTTCGKYTSSQSPTTTSTSAGIIGTAQASTSDSSAGALAAANLYDSSGDRDVPIVDSNGAHVDTGAKHRQLDSLSSSALIDTSMFSRQSSSASQPSSSQGSHHSTRLNALLTANQPSNRSPAPPPSPPPPPPPQQQPQHRHHYNHNHNKHFVLNSDSSSGGSSRHTGAEQHRNHYNNHAYQSDGTPTYYRPYYLSRQMLTNTSVTCNDGTVAGYYIRQNYASRRWIVFLEGGWYCFSALTCHQRWLKMRGLMTSAHWPEAKTVGGILSSSRDENPHYWNASHVYIPYCSSDIWSGDSPARAPGDLSFLGSRIVEQVIRELIPRGLADAKLIILAGSSAGAAGVMINLDRITQLLASMGSQAQVRGIADSGWILDNEPFTGGTGSSHHNNPNNNNHNSHNKKPCVDAINCAPMDGIKTAFKMWASRVPAACALQYPLEPWRCIFGYRLYPTLKTPLFVFQWLYDEAQMHMDGVSLTHSQQQFKYIHSLGRQLRATLENVSAVFTPSCVSHIVLTKPDWRSIAINGVRLPDAIRCWEQTCTGMSGTGYTVINRHHSSSNDTGVGAAPVVLNDWPTGNYYRKPENQKKKHKRRKHMRRRHKTKRDQIVLNDNSSNNTSNKGTGSSHHHKPAHTHHQHLQSHHNQHRMQEHRDQCHHWLVDDCQWPQCNRDCPKIHKSYMD